VFNFVANLSGIITPIVNETNSFNGALLFIGAVALLGALAHIFIVGEARRVDLKLNK
jgi:hypothetical protein